MSKFDRYMLSQLMTLFGFFALILVAVYWVNRAVRLFDQLISDGQSAWVFLEFTALSLPYNVRIVLPVAGFVAAIYVTNRLSTESELAVMKATGFSPWRLARPVLAFGLILGAGMALLSHVIEPAARTLLTDRRVAIEANVSQRVLSEGRFVSPAAGVTMFIGKIADTGEIRNLFISDERDPKTRNIYTADRGALVRAETGPKLVMMDGLVQSLTVADKTLTTTRFDDLTYDIGALVQSSSSRLSEPEELSTLDLLRASEASQKQTGRTAAALVTEAHDRIARSILPVVSVVIGFAALLQGSFSRFGLSRQIALAVGLLIVVQLVSNLAATSAQEDAARWPVMYVPGLLGAGMGAVLLWLSARPRRVRTAAGAEAAA